MGRRLGRPASLSSLFAMRVAALLLLNANAWGLSVAMPPQSLAPALETFAEKTGYQVVYRAEVAVGLTTQGSEAGLSATDTLTQLLRNTGLGFAFVNDRTVAIFKLSDGLRSSLQASGSRSVSPTGPRVGKDASNTTAIDTTTMGVKTVNQPGILKRIVGAFALFAGSFASADQAPEGTSAPLEEVTVTARRREESAQAVPIAITAFGADTLETRRIVNLESIQSAVPEFSISQASGRPNAPVYGLRGIRPTEAIYGQDPTVAVYFADVVMSPAEGTNLGLFDLASVQVLKGPQGTLFGRNTTGGAILMTPRRPDKTFGGNIMGGYGSFGRWEAQLGVDVPVAESFAVRIAGRSIQSDGYQTNVAPGPLFGSKLGGEETWNLRLSMVWDVSDSVENYTVFSLDNKDTNGRGTVLQALNPNTNAPVHCYDGPGNPNGGSPPVANQPGQRGTPTTACNTGNAIGIPNGTTIVVSPNEPLPDYFAALARAQNRDIHDVESDMPQFDKIAAWSVINTTTIKLSDALTLKGIGGYRDFQARSNYDIDASLIPGILTSTQVEDLVHASYELQLLGNSFDNRLSWVTGLYWYYEDGDQNSPGDVSRGLTSATSPFSQLGSVHNESQSVFAQGSYNLAEKWTLTAGARWTKDDKEMTVGTHTVTACLSTPTGAALVVTNGDFSNCKFTMSDSFSKATGTLSLDFKATDDVLLYAASRYGYRAGGFNLRATGPIAYVPFNPETVLDFELGTKADWSMGDWRMRSNVALYHQWYDDIQRTVGVSTGAAPSSIVTNAAKATVFGVEVQQTIAPTRYLTLQLNYAFTNPEYKNWTEVGSDAIPGTSPPQFPIVDLTDTPFHFTPKHSASGTITYAVPLSNDGEELSFSAGAAYRSRVWINALQTIQAIRRTPQSVQPFLQQGGYTTVDLNASWKSIIGSHFDIAAYVKNATDKEYSVGGIQLYESSYNSVSRTGLLTRAYGEPRTLGVEARYHF